MGQFRGPLVDVRYLHAAAEHIADFKARSLDALGLVPGATALDVGCGPGADARALAAASGCRVVGVDIDVPVLAGAGAGGAMSAAFICADATRLPFPDGAFDAVRSERMLQHLRNPARAVAEMARVTRPGGRLLLIDTDWASLTIEGAGTSTVGPLITDVLLRQVAASPTAARDLPAYAARAGLQTLKVSHAVFTTGDAGFVRLIAHLDMAEDSALAAGLLDEHRLAAWRAGLTSASRCGTLRASLTLITLLAVRPGGPVQPAERTVTP